MKINYNIEKINELITDFYLATGVSIDLFREDFSPAGAKSFFNTAPYCKCIQDCLGGPDACKMSDKLLFDKCKREKRTVIHTCHAGLVNVLVPIVYRDTIVGYMIFGQMKKGGDFDIESAFPEYFDLLSPVYNDMPVFDEEKINSLSRLADVLVKHILFEHMLKPTLDENLEKAVSFIEKNLKEDLTIEKISKGINVSKSVLYRLFHSHFGKTLGSFLNSKRIEYARSLLLDTSMSIEEISEEAGFSSASYFSKVFKKEVGISPLKYRKK